MAAAQSEMKSIAITFTDGYFTKNLAYLSMK